MMAEEGATRIYVTPTKMPVQRNHQASGRSKKKERSRYLHDRGSIERRMKPGKPGTPRYQRYLNARFFEDLRKVNKRAERDADDDDDNDDESTEEDRVEKDPIEQEESFFADLFNPEAQKLWEPFVNISVDEHDAHLAQLSSSIPQSSPTSCLPKQHGLPQRFWEPVQRCLNNAQYYMILCALESHVVHFLDFITDGLSQEGMDWEGSLSQCQFDEPSHNHLGVSLAIYKDKFPHMCLVLPDSYQRLLCHAVSAYYMLDSESENASDGRRITTVKIRQPRKSATTRGWKPSYPKTLLIHHVHVMEDE